MPSLVALASTLLAATPALATDDTDITPPTCDDQFQGWVLPNGHEVPPDAVIRLGTDRRNTWGLPIETCAYTLDLVVTRIDEGRSDVVVEDTLSDDGTGTGSWSWSDRLVPDAAYTFDLLVTHSRGQTGGWGEFWTTSEPGQDAPDAPVVVGRSAELDCDDTLTVQVQTSEARPTDVLELLLDGEIVDTTASTDGLWEPVSVRRTAGDHAWAEGDEICVEVRYRGIDDTPGEALQTCTTVEVRCAPERRGRRPRRDCGCQAAGGSGSLLAWLVVAALLGTRRRRA